MKQVHRVCDQCECNITKTIEDYQDGGDYLLKHNIHNGELDFCDEDCQKEYHQKVCEQTGDPNSNDSDGATFSTCLDCGYTTESPEL